MSRNRSFTRLLIGILTVGVFLLGVSSAAVAAAPQGAPEKLKVAMVDFLSGTAAVFGISCKRTSELLVDIWNKRGGIGGVPIELVIVDEGGKTDKQVTEFRRLVLEEKVDAVLGHTSSGNCLAMAPVANELKTLLVMHVCGTSQLEAKMGKGSYAFRTSNDQVSDSVILARWVMANKPDVKTIASIQPDYSWGRDCWEAFKIAMQKLKPDVKVKAELWPRLFAGEYSAEISRLLATRADVIHTSLWGGDLITFVNQAIPRGLFKQSTVLLSVGEQILQTVRVPDGTVALPRLTAGYFLDPDSETDPLQKEYVEGYKARFDVYPDYPAYRSYQAWAGLKAAYEKAIDTVGRWPTTEEVIEAFEGLSYEVPGGTVLMREDHQAITGGLIGVTKYSEKYGFPILVDRQRFSAEEVSHPLGMDPMDWVRSIK